MLRTALIAFGLLLAPAAQARDWWLMTTEPEQDLVVFADKDSIAEAGSSIRTVEMIMVFGQDRYGAAAGIVNLSIDCKAGRIRINAVTHFDDAGKQGVIEDGERSWDDISPDSNFGSLADLACGRARFETKSYGGELPIAAGRALLKNSM